MSEPIKDYPSTAFDPSTVGWRERLRWRYGYHFFEGWLYHALAEKWCGNDMVPLDHRTLEIKNSRSGCEYVFSFLNDSFEVGIGYPTQWHGIYYREDFHRMMFWYLRQWVFGEWFGLRRWIWYKLLDRKVERMRLSIKL